MQGRNQSEWRTKREGGREGRKREEKKKVVTTNKNFFHSTESESNYDGLSDKWKSVPLHVA